jgi:hypothetical protein
MNVPALDLSLIGRLFLYGVVASFILIAMGAPFVAAVCERLAVTRKRVFYDKLGMQLAAFALICGVGALPFPLALWVMDWAGNWFYLYVKHPNIPLPEFSLTLAGGASLLAAGCYALALAFVIAYRASWKALKQHKGLHSFLGFTASLLGLLTIGLALLYKRMALHDSGHGPASAYGVDALWRALAETSPASLLWPTLLVAALLSVSAAGGFGLVYLLLRRNTEDFGRDYYAFALKECSKWALIPTLVSMAGFGWLLVTQMGRLGPLALSNFKLVYLASGLVLLLVAATAWAMVNRSQTPLRHKPSVVLGCLCLPLALAAFFAFARFFLNG